MSRKSYAERFENLTEGRIRNVHEKHLVYKQSQYDFKYSDLLYRITHDHRGISLYCTRNGYIFLFLRAIFRLHKNDLLVNLSFYTVGKVLKANLPVVPAGTRLLSSLITS